jgi:hypothetical protein
MIVKAIDVLFAPPKVSNLGVTTMMMMMMMMMTMITISTNYFKKRFLGEEIESKCRLHNYVTRRNH